MHFIYQINRLTTAKVDSTYLGCLAKNAQRICPVAGLERMTTGSVVTSQRLTLSRHTVRRINVKPCKLGDSNVISSAYDKAPMNMLST